MSAADPQMKIRIPEELHQRIAEASRQTRQSMNATILSVLEREFPQPTINLHDLAAFLAGITNELADEEKTTAYLDEINRMLGSTKYPWTIRCEEGVVKFYPYSSTRVAEASKRLMDKGGPPASD